MRDPKHGRCHVCNDPLHASEVKDGICNICKKFRLTRKMVGRRYREGESA